MAVATQSVPQPKTVTLAEGFFVLSGRLSDLDAESRAQRNLRGIDRVLNAQLEDAPVYFLVADYPIYINRWEPSLVELKGGSIVVRFALIGTITLQVYGAIADYPSFKEAVPELIDDVRSVISWVVSSESDSNSPWRHPNPETVKVELFFKEEEEIAKKIRLLGAR